MLDTKDYTVTKLAGPKVAGVRVAAGDKITLTEPQARAELLAGAIVSDPSLVDDPFKAPSTPVAAPAAAPIAQTARVAAPIADKPADGLTAG